MVVSKEYKLGLLVSVGIILVFVAVNFMKSVANFGRSAEYYAIFENASGLKPGSEVQLSGVKIGEVLEVGLHSSA